MYEYFASLYVCTTCTWCPQRSKKDFEYSGTQVTMAVSHPAVAGNYELWSSARVTPPLSSCFVYVCVLRQGLSVALADLELAM